MNRRRLLKTMAAVGATATAVGIATGKAHAANRYYEGRVSDHFDGTRFFNPGGEEPGGFGNFLRWKLNGERARWPERWPAEPQFATPAERLPDSAMRVTLIGHATYLIQMAGLNILTDPVYSERVSPVTFAGPKRVNPPGIRFDELPPIDLVLLTHNHYDHLDVDTLGRLKVAHNPLVATPLGNDVIVRRHVPDMRITVMDWGQSFDFGPVSVHCEPAHHWSARGIGDRRMALWSAFALTHPAGNLYHIGDTGFHSGINYRDAGRKFGAFRLACLPIGAYEPRWFMRAQHQNPDDAVEGFRLCNASFAAGHHWGTFQLTDEAIDAPSADLDTAIRKAGLDAARFRALWPSAAWDIPPGAV